ncbi:MAG: MFS transporter [Acidobacteriota bacterium]
MTDTGNRKNFSAAGAIILAYIAFISLGLPDGLLGVAWPNMRHDFARALDSLGMLLVAGTTGYLLSSFFSGHILVRFGVGSLLAASCALTGMGLIGYSLSHSWWLMVPLAAAGGLGAGAIDAGINVYVAANYGERTMQWLHASYGIGITLGPMIMTAGLALSATWRTGYALVGAAQLILAFCFMLTHTVWKAGRSDDRSKHHDERGGHPASIMETLGEVRVWVSMLLFFVYCGIEASVGMWSYSLLTESRGIPPSLAGIWVGGYWATFTIGRIAAGIFTKRMPIGRLIAFCIAVAGIGALVLIWNPFFFSSLLAVAVIGFAIAPIYPGLVFLTSRRVGARFTPQTIGMQTSAAGLGLAIIPALTGIAARHTSLETVPLLILIWTVLLFIVYIFAMQR